MNRGKLKKNILAASSAILIFNASDALSLENQVKIGGAYEAQLIHYKNNGKKEQKKVSFHNKNFGFNSGSHLYLDYRLISDYNHIYGAKISIENTTENDRSAPFYIYYEADFGRFEAGSESSAGKKMRITGYSASCAMGNSWTSVVQLAPFAPNGTDRLTSYITNFCGFLDTKIRTSKKADYSRKLTYFTPKLNVNENHQVQLGISYIPDSSNMGHSQVGDDYKYAPQVIAPYKFVFKDGISYGIAYSGKFDDSLSAKVSLVGENAKTLAFNKKDNSKADEKFKNVNTYVVGGELKYNNIGFSAAYTNYNKSVTAKNVDLIGRDGYAYGLGIKYTLNKYAFSINQFNSNYKKSTLNITSLAIDYMVAKGFKTYIQTNFYKTNGKYIENNTIKSDKNKGILTYLGAKISF